MSESSGSSDNDSWDDNGELGIETDAEEEEETEIVRCLFCSVESCGIEDALLHTKNEHHVDFSAFKNKFQMDCYSFIKFINFIRKNHITPEFLVNDVDCVLWDDEVYLKPVEEFDPWLIFDYEEYFELMANNESVTNHSDHRDNQIEQLQKELQAKNDLISSLSEKITQMKNFVHKIFDDDETLGERKRAHFSNDNGYFESYGHHGIHHDMLSDDIRTMSYKNAITQNAAVFFDKTVLDLGCGTGILSLFAASAGAKKVYAVDNSDIAFYAVAIVRENNLMNKIDVVKARIESDDVVPHKVDIIISEWMGYFLLFEGMLDSLIYARETYLKPDGILLPNKCNLFICGANDEEGYKRYIEFWNNVYGYSMNCIKQEVLKEVIIDVIPQEKIVTSSCNIATFDLYKCSVEDTCFTSQFELTSNKDTVINAFVGYFDTIFELPNSFSFSTDASSPATHWKQTLFYISNPIHLSEGEQMKGSLTCRRITKDGRSLLINIAVKNHEYNFELQ